MLECFSPKGKRVLESYGAPEMPNKVNQVTSGKFICFFCDNIWVNFKDAKHLSLMDEFQGFKAITGL